MLAVPGEEDRVSTGGEDEAVRILYSEWERAGFLRGCDGYVRGGGFGSMGIVSGAIKSGAEGCRALLVSLKSSKGCQFW